MNDRSEYFDSCASHHPRGGARVEVFGPVVHASQLGGARRDVDQLVTTPDRVLAERLYTRELIIPPIELRLTAPQPLDVPLLRSQQVEDGRRKSPIGPGCGHLQPLLRETAANVEKVQVRPLVVAERFDQ